MTHLKTFLNKDVAARIQSSVLWVPTVHYANFMDKRLTALATALKALHTCQPRQDNHIRLSGLFSYLLQALTTTPVSQESFVHSALKDLHLGATAARFGVFFLDTLNLESTESFGLELTETRDDFDVITSSGVNLPPPTVRTTCALFYRKLM